MIKHLFEMKLTKEQEKAVKSLEKALKQCKKAKLYIHNCYGTLKVFDGNVIDYVNDKRTEISCEAGRTIDCHIQLDSWADDWHYVHIKEPKY